MEIEHSDLECFPEAYKHFKFKAGDLLAQNGDGLWGLIKIIKVDTFDFAAGEEVNIQGEDVVLKQADSLIVVSLLYSQLVYSSLEELKQAVANKSWIIEIGHLPIRTIAIDENSEYLGHEPVVESELDGYQFWLEAFKNKDAGIF